MAPEGTIPPRPGVLRPRAEGALGRRPPRPGDRRAGHPGRPVGHGEGVAAQSPPAPARPRRSGRRSGCASAVRSTLTHRSLDADTKRIMAALVDQLPDEARESQRRRRAEELAATYPPGYRGDPTREADAGPAPTRDDDREEATWPTTAPPTRAALRAAHVRRRGVDVERREGPVAQPERRHADRCSTGRPTSSTSAPRSPRPSPTCPRLRERVVPGVGRFSPPVWRPDPEFDLDYHVRQVALPAPGDAAPAARPRRRDLPGPLRPHPPAVDVLRHRGAGGRPRRRWSGRSTTPSPTASAPGASPRRTSSRHAEAPDAAARRPRCGRRRAPSPPTPSRTRRRRRSSASLRRHGDAHACGARPASPGGSLGELAMWGADPLRAA